MLKHPINASQFILPEIFHGTCSTVVCATVVRANLCSPSNLYGHKNHIFRPEIISHWHLRLSKVTANVRYVVLEWAMGSNHMRLLWPGPRIYNLRPNIFMLLYGVCPQTGNRNGGLFILRPKVVNRALLSDQ